MDALYEDFEKEEKGSRTYGVRTHNVLEEETDLKIIKFFMFPYKTRAPKQGLRPIQLNADQDTLDKLKDSMISKKKDSNLHLSRLELAETMGGLTTLSNVAVKQINLPNGWHETRYMFIACFEATNLVTQRIYIQGYTDYAPRVMANTLPDDLIFYINSAVAIRHKEAKYRNPRTQELEKRTTVEITNSVVFLENIVEAEEETNYVELKDGLRDRIIKDYLCAMRPSDIITAVSDMVSLSGTYTSDGEDDFLDTGTSIGSRHLKTRRSLISNRDSNSTLNYGSFILNSYIQSKNLAVNRLREDGQNSYAIGDSLDSQNVFNTAIVKTSVLDLCTLPFFKEIYQFNNTSNTFRFEDLKEIFPPRHIRENVNVYARPIQREITGIPSRNRRKDYRYIDDIDDISGGFKGTSEVDIAIESFVHSVHSFMVSLFFTKVSFSFVVNGKKKKSSFDMLLDGDDVNCKVVIYNLDSFFEGIDIVNSGATHSFKKMIEEYLSYGVTFGYEEDILITMDADILSDSVVTFKFLGVDMDPRYYVIPAFADSTYSPTISTRRNTSSTARKLQNLYEYIDSAYDSNHLVYKEDNDFSNRRSKFKSKKKEKIENHQDDDLFL